MVKALIINRVGKCRLHCAVAARKNERIDMVVIHADQRFFETVDAVEHFSADGFELSRDVKEIIQHERAAIASPVNDEPYRRHDDAPPVLNEMPRRLALGLRSTLPSTEKRLASSALRLI